jgi:hypothetical protein
VFPNITIEPRICISLSALVASGERTFSMLEQGKKFYLVNYGTRSFEWFRRAQYQA